MSRTKSCAQKQTPQLAPISQLHESSCGLKEMHHNSPFKQILRKKISVAYSPIDKQFVEGSQGVTNGTLPRRLPFVNEEIGVSVVALDVLAPLTSHRQLYPALGERAEQLHGQGVLNLQVIVIALFYGATTAAATTGCHGGGKLVHYLLLQISSQQAQLKHVSKRPMNFRNGSDLNK